MPINKTKVGTFTIKGGNGSSSDPYIWDAVASSNDRSISRTLYGSDGGSDGIWIKVYCSPNTNYEFWWSQGGDGDLSVYNQNKSEVNWWDHNFCSDYRGYYCNEMGSYTTSSSQEYFFIRAGEYSHGRPSGNCHIMINPLPLEIIPEKIYNNSPNFDEQGYMVDYFDLKKPKLDAPIVAKGGLDFDLSFNEGLKERITGITGIIEDKTYFELANDNTVGTYLLCKKIFGSKKKVNFPGTENLFQYGTGDFTVSFWMKAPNWVGFAQSVLSKHDGSSGFSIFNTVNNTTDVSMEMRISQSGSNVDLSSTALGEDKWVHWLYMRKNNYGYWYKNGEKIAEVSLGEKNINNNAPLEIGFSNCLDYAGANFGIKSLKVYGKSMKDYEIIGLSKEFRI